MHRVVFLICIIAAAVSAQVTFAGAKPFYRLPFSIAAGNTKLYGDTPKRRAVITNYGGSEVYSVQLDTGKGFSLNLQNANSQGASFIDSKSNTLYTLSCNGNDVYLGSVDLQAMNQTGSRKLTEFNCADLPSCAVYDPNSMVAYFALTTAKVATTINVASGVVSKSSTPMANDNKDSCAFDTKNRVGYFLTATSAFYVVNTTANQIAASVIQGALATDKFTQPKTVFDSTNSVLYITAQASKFTLVRYQALIANWTTLTDSGLAQGEGLMVDQATGYPYVFTRKATNVLPDATFQSTNPQSIGVWSLTGQGFVDNNDILGTTTGYALDRDIAELVSLNKNAAVTLSNVVAFVVVAIVCLLL
jgi:hypothetical protein